MLLEGDGSDNLKQMNRMDAPSKLMRKIRIEALEARQAALKEELVEITNELTSLRLGKSITQEEIQADIYLVLASNPDGVRGIVGLRSRMCDFQGMSYHLTEISNWIKQNPEAIKKVKGRYFLP